jgi:hypothetical protein
MKIIGIIFILIFYARLYVHFIVNPNNECSILEEITKEEITNKVYTKLPFVFDATGMKSGTTPLIEPYVRFVSEQKVYEDKKWTETRETCRTFYRIKQGCYEVRCIHPKYKELVSHPKLLKQNTQIIQDIYLGICKTPQEIWRRADFHIKNERNHYYTLFIKHLDLYLVNHFL